MQRQRWPRNLHPHPSCFRLMTTTAPEGPATVALGKCLRKPGRQLISPGATTAYLGIIGAPVPVHPVHPPAISLSHLQYTRLRHMQGGMVGDIYIYIRPWCNRRNGPCSPHTRNTKFNRYTSHHEGVCQTHPPTPAHGHGQG